MENEIIKLEDLTLIKKIRIQESLKNLHANSYRWQLGNDPIMCNYRSQSNMNQRIRNKVYLYEDMRAFEIDRA